MCDLSSPLLSSPLTPPYGSWFKNIDFSILIKSHFDEPMSQESVF